MYIDLVSASNAAVGTLSLGWDPICTRDTFSPLDFVDLRIEVSVHHVIHAPDIGNFAHETCSVDRPISSKVENPHGYRLEIDNCRSWHVKGYGSQGARSRCNQLESVVGVLGTSAVRSWLRHSVPRGGQRTCTRAERNGSGCRDIDSRSDIQLA